MTPAIAFVVRYVFPRQNAEKDIQAILDIP